MADYRKLARAKAKKYGIDPDVFERQIQQESGFAPDVISGKRRSSAGALGIAQIMPATAKGWGVDPLDPDAALDAAAKNMARYVKQFGSYDAALRAYNAGPGAVEKSKGYAETNDYVRKILQGGEPKSTPRTGGSAPKSSSRSTTTTTTRTERDVQGAILDALASGRPGSKLKQASALLDTGAYDRQVTDTKTVRSKAAKASSSRKPGKGDPGFTGSPIFEAFYDPEGGIDNGREVGAIGNHDGHVHVAAGPETILRFGKMAQKYGLTVRENPHFDKVDPVHTKGSFHYRDRAIDVSGDPEKMRAFYRAVKAYDQRVRRR